MCSLWRCHQLRLHAIAAYLHWHKAGYVCKHWLHTHIQNIYVWNRKEKRLNRQEQFRGRLKPFPAPVGFLERLLDSHSALARHALQKAVFYVVPNMNPDGSWRGHLRTNAAGANLNREWAKPSLEISPEVCYCYAPVYPRGEGARGGWFDTLQRLRTRCLDLYLLRRQHCSISM